MAIGILSGRRDNCFMECRMSSETGSAETQLPAAVYRRLLFLVPARSLGSILSELSSLWCDAFNTDAVFLGVVDPHAARLTAALFRAGRSDAESFTSESIPLSPDYPLEDQLASLFERVCSFSEVSSEPVQFYSRACHEQCMAGLFLFSAADLQAVHPLVLELLEVTERLLNQCLIQQFPHSSGQQQGGSVDVVRDETAPGERQVIPSVDKLEAMAEFAAGAGHEINNPVATIVGRVQMLLKDETDPERRQSLTTIGGQAYRVRDMIGDAMLFARPPAPRPALLSLLKTIEEVLHSLQEEIQQSGAQVDLDVSGSQTIWADETQWKVVLSNLILNSLHAIERRGRIQVRAGMNLNEEQRVLHLRVIDDGAGLTDEERIHLFDPFYSARQAGRGLGFGLSKCWRIVTLHGGTISAELNQDHGITFHLHWPAENPLTSAD